MATARILSIDDSPTVLKLIEMIGQSAGYEVHVASDGARGVAMAAELHPDVILVDFIMPEMNGLQVCKALRDNPETRDIPVILVSSKGDAVGDKFVESLGVRHYCTKPFKADDLLAKLAEVLGERGGKAAAEEAAPSEATAGRERPLVLSIDDSPTILRLVEMILGNAGFEVRTAAGGAKGIELARSLKPDVVLVDFIMPEVNGFQVCKTLRGDPELGQVPIILVSSKGESVGEQFVNTLGIHHYLTKPFQPDQLVAEVRRALEAAGKGAAVKPEGAAGEAPPAAPAPAAEPAPTAAASVPPEQMPAPEPARGGAAAPTPEAEVAALLKAHLDAQLAAMEERLVQILDMRLRQVLAEIRGRSEVAGGP